MLEKGFQQGLKQASKVIAKSLKFDECFTKSMTRRFFIPFVFNMFGTYGFEASTTEKRRSQAQSLSLFLAYFGPCGSTLKSQILVVFGMQKGIQKETWRENSEGVTCSTLVCLPQMCRDRLVALLVFRENFV